jgi:ketosteroid isomerase-like protein
MRRLLAATGLLLLVAGTSRSQSEAPISSAIIAVLDSQAVAWNRGDITGYMNGYWNSDSLIFTSGGRVRRGWEATRASYLASYGSRERMGVLTFSELEVHILTAESAWVLGRWRLERAGDSPGGIFSVVLRKFSGGWKIVHDHTSSDPAAAKDSTR